MDIPDLGGRVAVVTGANSGLGLETAKALAGAGAAVVMAVRDRVKAAGAERSIRSTLPDATLTVVDLDLSSLESVGQAARMILGDRVDILVNNAGVMAMPQRRTVDGFEMQLGVNHLGHWVLTARLMPALLAAEEARVVSLTSFARHVARRIDPDDPHLVKGYTPWKAYNRSKLACYLFGIGLQREFDRRGLAARSVVADPGFSSTNLQATTIKEGGVGWTGRFWHWFAGSIFGSSPEEGASMSVRAATDPDLDGQMLVSPRYITRGPPVLRAPRRPGLDRAVDTLWEVSRRDTGIGLFDFVD